MAPITMGSPVYAFVDGTKGSMTNRAQCAKEHFKNNAKFYLGTTAIGAGITAVAVKPSIATKLATGIGKLAKAVGLDKMATVIAKNPKKFGLLGLGVAGAIALTSLVQSHAYKAGQIDQKYTDAAAIESQTKNVVLG